MDEQIKVFWLDRLHLVTWSFQMMFSVVCKFVCYGTTRIKLIVGAVPDQSLTLSIRGKINKQKLVTRFENFREHSLPIKMVWGALKNKPQDDTKRKNTKKNCCKCGNRCKKCGDTCKCTIKRIYIRPPMFNYYTDMMH